jgi:hypothetical protein
MTLNFKCRFGLQGTVFINKLKILLRSVRSARRVLPDFRTVQIHVPASPKRKIKLTVISTSIWLDRLYGPFACDKIWNSKGLSRKLKTCRPNHNYNKFMTSVVGHPLHLLIIQIALCLCPKYWQFDTITF